MKASGFPRAYRAWLQDTNELLYGDDLLARGLTLTPDGLPYFSERPFPVVLMWFTGQRDNEGKPLFEGDICKIYVRNEFGSIIVDYGVMRWNPNTSSFHLAVPSTAKNQQLNVAKFELLGNEFENQELVPLVSNQEPANG